MESFEKRVVRKTTFCQFELLIAELEKNPRAARGLPAFSSNRGQYEDTWEIISNKMNALGPPHRNVSEWKKVWSDLRARTKRKITDNMSNSLVTGSKKYNGMLSDLELAVDRIANLSETVTTDQSIIAEVLEGEMFAPALPEPVTPPSSCVSIQSRRKRRIKNKTLSLLRLQIQKQDKLIELFKQQVAATERQAAAIEKQAALTQDILRLFTPCNVETAKATNTISPKNITPTNAIKTPINTTTPTNTTTNAKTPTIKLLTPFAGLPKLTRNPHIPPVCSAPNELSKTDVALSLVTATTPIPNHVIQEAGKVIVIAKHQSADECVLPDDSNFFIKEEMSDDIFIY